MVKNLKHTSIEAKFIINSTTAQIKPVNSLCLTTEHTIRSVENRIIGHSVIICKDEPLRKFINEKNINDLRRNRQNRLITREETKIKIL